MDDPQVETLKRENEHLKVRIDQLQGEVWDLSGQLARSQQMLERSGPYRTQAPPNPLSGGRWIDAVKRSNPVGEEDAS